MTAEGTQTPESTVLAPLEALEHLAEFRKNGVLSEEEFQTAKERVFAAWPDAAKNPGARAHGADAPGLDTTARKRPAKTRANAAGEPVRRARRTPKKRQEPPLWELMEPESEPARSVVPSPSSSIPDLTTPAASPKASTSKAPTAQPDSEVIPVEFEGSSTDGGGPDLLERPDHVHLTCPDCGRKQSVPKQAQEFICRGCRSAWRIARCPKCNKTTLAKQGWAAWKCKTCGMTYKAYWRRWRPSRPVILAAVLVLLVVVGLISQHAASPHGFIEVTGTVNAGVCRDTKGSIEKATLEVREAGAHKLLASTTTSTNGLAKTANGSTRACDVDFKVRLPRIAGNYEFLVAGEVVGSKSAAELTSGSLNQLFAHKEDPTHGVVSASPVGPGKVDRFFEVPVPANAMHDAKYTKPNQSAYQLPVSESFASLKAFYDQRMPPGRPWGGMAWCESFSEGTGSVPELYRSWRLPGTNTYLSLTLFGPEQGHGPSLWVGNDTYAADDPNAQLPCSGAVDARR